MRDRRGACPTQTGGRLRCRHDARPAASRGSAASSDSRWSRVATSRPRQPTRERTRALSMPSLGCGAHARLAHCLHPSLEDVCGFELDGRYPPMAYPPSALTDATSIKDGRPRSRVLISELEHGGYESAARCLSDDLDALVVHLLPDEGQGTGFSPRASGAPMGTLASRSLLTRESAESLGCVTFLRFSSGPVDRSQVGGVSLGCDASLRKRVDQKGPAARVRGLPDRVGENGLAFIGTSVGPARSCRSGNRCSFRRGRA